MRNSNILKWAQNMNNNKSGKDAAENRNWIHPPEALSRGHIAYLVKFLGNLEVDQPKGIEVVKEGIRKLKFNQQHLRKSEGSKLPKVELTISVDGVAIQEPKTKRIMHQYPLHRISYCADDKAERRFFSFIVKETPESEQHMCFVFLSDKLAEEITLTIGQAFDLAYKLSQNDPIWNTSWCGNKANKRTFRSGHLDVNKTLPIYYSDELPDLQDYAGRAVPQMPTGMEKDEEAEHHLQRAMVTGHVIPTPEVYSIDQQIYDLLYPSCFTLPRRLIHMQPFTFEQDIPEYDIDSEDEEWLKNQTKSIDLSNKKFEEMVDRLERNSDHTVVSEQDAKALLRDYDESLIIAVYDYWLNKRFKTKHNLQPSVKTELRGNMAINDPYLAFRRRKDKMQTRKNRKNDESSYEKMIKLNWDLNSAHDIIEMIKKREYLKKDLVQIHIDIFKKRYEIQDWNGTQYQDAILLSKSMRNNSIPLSSNTNKYNNISWNTHNNISNNNKKYNNSTNYNNILIDDDNLISNNSNNKKEKRHYKKRKLKNITSNLTTSETSNNVNFNRVSSDDEQNSSISPQISHHHHGHSHSEENSYFTFRRNPGVSYATPRPVIMTDYEFSSKEDGGLGNIKHRFNPVYMNNTKPNNKNRCIGLGRRRIGRGGRVILDRIGDSFDDLWNDLDIKIIENERYFRPKTPPESFNEDYDYDVDLKDMKLKPYIEIEENYSTTTQTSIVETNKPIFSGGGGKNLPKQLINTFNKDNNLPKPMAIMQPTPITTSSQISNITTNSTSQSIISTTAGSLVQQTNITTNSSSQSIIPTTNTSTLQQSNITTGSTPQPIVPTTTSCISQQNIITNSSKTQQPNSFVLNNKHLYTYNNNNDNTVSVNTLLELNFYKPFVIDKDTSRHVLEIFADDLNEDSILDPFYKNLIKKKLDNNNSTVTKMASTNNETSNNENNNDGVLSLDDRWNQLTNHNNNDNRILYNKYESTIARSKIIINDNYKTYIETARNERLKLKRKLDTHYNDSNDDEEKIDYLCKKCKNRKYNNNEIINNIEYNYNKEEMMTSSSTTSTSSSALTTLSNLDYILNKIILYLNERININIKIKNELIKKLKIKIDYYYKNKLKYCSCINNKSIINNDYNNTLILTTSSSSSSSSTNVIHKTCLQCGKLKNNNPIYESTPSTSSSSSSSMNDRNNDVTPSKLNKNVHTINKNLTPSSSSSLSNSNNNRYDEDIINYNNNNCKESICICDNIFPRPLFNITPLIIRKLLKEKKILLSKSYSSSTSSSSSTLTSSSSLSSSVSTTTTTTTSTTIDRSEYLLPNSGVIITRQNDNTITAVDNDRRFLEMEVQRRLMVLQQRVNTLETENNVLKKRLTDIANGQDVDVYMRINGLTDITVVDTSITNNGNNTSANNNTNNSNNTSAVSNTNNNTNGTSLLLNLNDPPTPTSNGSSLPPVPPRSFQNDLLSDLILPSSISGSGPSVGRKLEGLLLDEMLDDDFDPRAYESSNNTSSATNNITALSQSTSGGPPPTSTVPPPLLAPPPNSRRSTNHQEDMFGLTPFNDKGNGAVQSSQSRDPFGMGDFDMAAGGPQSSKEQDLQSAIGFLDRRILEMKDGFTRGLAIGTEDFSIESLDPLRKQI